MIFLAEVATGPFIRAWTVTMHATTHEIVPRPYPFDRDRLSALLAALIQQQAPAGAWNWLDVEAATGNAPRFYGAFAQMPRKTGKSVIAISTDDAETLNALVPHFTIGGWTLDRLARVWLLLQLDASDRERYLRQVEQLFRAADMNELVAAYSALPVLAYGPAWKLRCAEGIRSNIGDVLEAIMCRNPYPAAHLDDPAWNQMVLKAFFTGKPVNEIVGLAERNNPELAAILIDYAHERQAAGRPVNPLLWRCVAPFLDEGSLPDIARLLESADTGVQAAGALACRDSRYPPAQALLKQYPRLEGAVVSGALSWDALILTPS
ncbi:EboA domain-containing protein [Flaviaesturariibacter amylovorans]|uniref:Uncharacterized protein n=1 Tax=Flaviaesturariibacter amylovorans TaxID=1084520 RepID=A0ABP8HSB5_9BACT